MDTKTTFRFRPMAANDAAELARVHAAASRAPWSKEMFAKELMLPFSWQCVAASGRELVGFAVVWIVAERADLIELAVAPDFQRQGAGEGLLNRCLSAARKRGAKSMGLEFREGNLAAQKLYEKLGFETSGKRRQFYSADDGILMTAELR